MEIHPGNPNEDDRLSCCEDAFAANLLRFEALLRQAARLSYQAIRRRALHQELVVESRARIVRSRIVLARGSRPHPFALQAQHRMNSKGVPVDRPTVLKHLALVEKHITTGARNIARQKKNIAELETHGADLSRARETLATFEHTQALFLAERQRIKEELEDASPTSTGA